MSYIFCLNNILNKIKDLSKMLLKTLNLQGSPLVLSLFRKPNVEKNWKLLSVRHRSSSSCPSRSATRSLYFRLSAVLEVNTTAAHRSVFSSFIHSLRRDPSLAKPIPETKIKKICTVQFYFSPLWPTSMTGRIHFHNFGCGSTNDHSCIVWWKFIE